MTRETKTSDSAFSGEDSDGLTKLEWFTGMALMGLWSGSSIEWGATIDAQQMASHAVRSAEATITRLNGEKS